MKADILAQHKASYEAIYESSGIRDNPNFYRWIVRLLHPDANWRVLDVACGEGGLVTAIQGQASEVWGLDISERALARAHTQAHEAVLLVGDAEQLPLRSQSFDCVTCLGSLENLADPLQSLREIHRLLKNNGIFCAMMPNKFWLGDILQVWFGGDESIPYQHVERTATLRQWRLLLEQHGFVIQRVKGYIKTSPLFKEGKLRSVRKFLVTHLLAFLCPPSLAWSIVFICKKSREAPMLIHTNPPWTWRVEWMKIGK